MSLAEAIDGVVLEGQMVHGQPNAEGSAVVNIAGDGGADVGFPATSAEVTR
jgi:hypothetical protein